MEKKKSSNKINIKNLAKIAKENMSKMNFLLLFFMILYTVFGLVMILSASSIAAVLRYEVSANHFFKKQLLFMSVSFFVGLIAIIHVPTKNYKYFSKLFIGGVILALIVIFSSGITAGGAKSWFDLGTFNVQPSEIAKLALIIYLALYYQKLNMHNKISFFDMIKPLLVAGVTVLLVAMQPDLGGAAIVFLITIIIFFSLPFGKKHKKVILGLSGIGILLFGLCVFCFKDKLLNQYQINRLFNFTKPCERYTEDSGYQVCNGYIAIHNGGLTGAGLGESTQKYMYLPEAHTDFIFPIICEELGLIVGIIVVLGYIIMLFVILDIAKSTDNLRNSILVYGVFCYLLAHVLINLLGVLGLVPLTGVPLPFLSYGGSYNITLIASLFIVQRINIENKSNRIRRRIENL